jgi:putative membrane protein
MSESWLVLLLGVVPAAVLGALAGSSAACIPSLHIYTLIGGLLLLPPCVFAANPPGLWLAALIIGLVTGWTIVNTVPAILLAAPDESALFTVLPGQRYLMSRRGYEAVMLTAFGAAGAIALVLAGTPFAPRVLPDLHHVLTPHYHWIIWTVVAFMLMSEWPKGRTAALGSWDRFTAGTANAMAGLATFLLSGVLGFVMLYRSPLPIQMASQNLMPVFAGLFALPWLIVNLVSRLRIPAQHRSASVRANPSEWVRGIAGGTLGGAFSAFVPVVSGGLGGMLAGHATSLRNERAFLISQGASKTVYYVGGLLLLFVPGLQVTRGAGASMLHGLYSPAREDYWPAVAAVAVATATALAVLPLCARLTLRAMERFGHRALSWGALVLIVLLVLGLTRGTGLAVMLVSTGIGLIPALFDSRRMNCLGVILLPIACNLSGVGPDIARFLGLL